MQNLHFGRRARRRARLRRVLVGVWIAAIGGTALGLPGPGLGLDLIGRLVEGDDLGAVSTADAAGDVETTESAAGLMRVRREVFEGRPAPPPTEAPEEPAETATETVAAPVAAPGSIEEIIYNAAAAHGIDGAYLLSVAACESGLDPNAYNPAGYHGLFQFDQTTWSAYGSGSIYDPVAQANAAASLLAAGQASRWPNCA
ncbi:MAG TPA: transglycosylase SLT domain-containing protein [Actinomycetota bacterium]|nr:transglycosylase SLT domain-containing protein [Actinomycetota bacterium]